MRRNLVQAIFLCTFAAIFCISTLAQSGPNAETRGSGRTKNTSTADPNGGNPVLEIAGKVSVVIIKSAAKTAWATTKFAAKDIAKPILVGIVKPLLLKATPQITMFALKLTGNSLKKGIPIATKLGMTYLRAKLPF